MKRIILVSILILAMATVAFAQMGAPGGWVSPQSTATEGRYRSTADNFIRPDAYAGVSFNNWFGMTSYAAAGNPGTAHLGFATRAGKGEDGTGGVYVAGYYGGTFWRNYPNITYTEQHNDWLSEKDKSGVKIYNDIPSISGVPNNNVALLLGVADMGFRLSLTSTHRSIKDENFVYNDGSSDQYYKSYEEEAGAISPQLAWSMAKDLTSNGIRPYFALDLDFNKNYKKYETYEDAAGDEKWVANNEIIGLSNNFTLTRIRTGLGGYTIVNKNGFRSSVDLDYDLRLTGYDNDYNYDDKDGNTKVKTGFNGTVSMSGSNPPTLTERSDTSHTIIPSIAGQWSGSGVALRFKLNLNVGLSNSTQSNMGFKVDSFDGALVKEEDKTVSTISFNPDLRLAAQWRIVPKLTLNLGGRIDLNSIVRTTTEGKYYDGEGKEVEKSSYKTIKTENAMVDVSGSSESRIRNTLATGVTFNVTDNMTFEAATGASNGTASVFQAPGGLFHFTNLLVSLRF